MLSCHSIVMHNTIWIINKQRRTKLWSPLDDYFIAGVCRLAYTKSFSSVDQGLFPVTAGSGSRKWISWAPEAEPVLWPPGRDQWSTNICVYILYMYICMRERGPRDWWCSNRGAACPSLFSRHSWKPKSSSQHLLEAIYIFRAVSIVTGHLKNCSISTRINRGSAIERQRGQGVGGGGRKKQSLVYLDVHRDQGQSNRFKAERVPFCLRSLPHLLPPSSAFLTSSSQWSRPLRKPPQPPPSSSSLSLRKYSCVLCVCCGAIIIRNQWPPWKKKQSVQSLRRRRNDKRHHLEKIQYGCIIGIKKSAANEIQPLVFL